MGLKELISARGFVSDVTVKRREEALEKKIHVIREEKTMAKKRVKELEMEYLRQQEQLRRLETEQRALEELSKVQKKKNKLGSRSFGGT